jgi:hypothetical protein
MGTMLEADTVIGTDVSKVRQGLWLLVEAGLNKNAIDNIRYELQTDECAGCHQHWQRKVCRVAALPTWRHKFERGASRPKDWPSSKLLGKVDNLIEGYDADEHPVMLAYRNAVACPTCYLTVADQIAESVCRLPKKLLNTFCRAFSLTIGLQREEYGRDWSKSEQYAGYVALTNALIQRLNPAGNQRALKLLVNASHQVGML